ASQVFSATNPLQIAYSVSYVVDHNQRSVYDRHPASDVD
ncbi:MAG: hypothetical protein JWR37_578, partial [Mycobacterium sp.]|nr:hypothetical protein [Mycobacterium sp.]